MLKKEETILSALNKYNDNWYKVTCENPELFNHKISSRKCSKCGGEIHYREDEKITYYWCINCHDQFFENTKDNNEN